MHARLAHVDETSPPTPVAPKFALWELGFRPFYLLASAFAAISVGVWALQFTGHLSHAYLQGPAWHAHEMLFGFTLAVVVGFLFTAGRNWTSRPTPKGPALAALAALWLAGRILVLTPFPVEAAVASAAFPAAAAVALAIPLVAARNRRNYFFIGVLLALAGADVLFHLAHAGVVSVAPWASIQAGLDVILFIMTVMAGRVVPMFTNNGVMGAAAKSIPSLERFVLGSTLAVLVADLASLRGPALVALLALCTLAHLMRWLLWQPWKTLRTPVVWVLHVAYLWIPVHLALRAFAALGWSEASAATHALTVGAIGGLVIGMMTRTARGHTGRPLRAGRSEIASYVLVALAAGVRTFVPLVAPVQTLVAVVVSAVLWSAAFGIYAVTYAPILMRARQDGRPG